MNEFLVKVRATLPVFGTLGTVGGFVADVLQPIFPFVSYIFFASAVACLGILIALVVKASIRSTAATALVFSFFIMSVSGCMYFLQSPESKQSGVLANAVPSIKSLQLSLGMMQKDLSTIKDSTQRIEHTSVRTEKKLDAVGHDTKALVANTQKIADRIDVTLNELLKSGGVIKSPQTPQDFYANARIYELQGDFANAQHSYVKFIQFDLDYLDPHIRYQKLLKVQNGLEGAREVYLELTQTSTSLAARFARILMFSRTMRIKKTTDFLALHPDFGPAYLMLSREYSEARLGEQTSEDKLHERTYLKAFIAQSEKGNVIKYFMDKEMASTWLEGAKSNIAKLGLLSDDALKHPISLYMMPTNTAWMIQVSSIDKITELFYAWDDAQTDFVSTGFSGVIDISTGNPMPNFTIQAPLSLQKQTIHFKYKGLRGKMHGPFSISIDPDKERGKSAKRTLEATVRSWIYPRKFDGKTMFYFTHLQSYACGIDKVLYAFDRDVNLSEKLEIQDCIAGSANKVGSAATWIQAPAETTYMAVQIVYVDGTLSKLERYTVVNESRR